MVELEAEMKDIRRRLWTKDLTRSDEDLEERMEAIELRNQPAA